MCVGWAWLVRMWYVKKQLFNDKKFQNWSGAQKRSGQQKKLRAQENIHFFCDRGKIEPSIENIFVNFNLKKIMLARPFLGPTPIFSKCVCQ